MFFGFASFVGFVSCVKFVNFVSFVGVKFLLTWSFIGYLGVCFVEPLYFQMTINPMFTHGLDVIEILGIVGWLVISIP